MRRNRFNNRKGVSGGAVFFERSLVRSLSRQQQALSLSSCEAELYGLHGHSCAQYSTAEPKKTQVLKIAAAANPPLQRVHLRPQYLQVEAHF